MDNVHDTSYFTSRQCWNSAETRLFADPNYESSDYESSASGRSTSSSETRPEDSVSYKFRVFFCPSLQTFCAEYGYLNVQLYFPGYREDWLREYVFL